MTLSQALQQTPQTSYVQRSGFSWHQTNKCLSHAAAVLRSSFIAMLIASLAGHQPVTFLLLIGLRLRTDQLIKKCFCQRATHWCWPAPFPTVLKACSHPPMIHHCKIASTQKQVTITAPSFFPSLSLSAAYCNL